jgi:hypothetical protein
MALEPLFLAMSSLQTDPRPAGLCGLGEYHARLFERPHDGKHIVPVHSVHAVLEPAYRGQADVGAVRCLAAVEE